MKELRDIKLVVSDFDGVFTDGKLTVYSDGKTSKVVDYKDIMAIAVLLKKQINFAIISGEKSAAIDRIKDMFPSVPVYQNIRNKLEILKELIKKYEITKDNVVYIGDDINDIECLEYVKYPFTVKNSHKSIKEIEDITITENNGGEGAFREVADIVK